MSLSNIFIDFCKDRYEEVLDCAFSIHGFNKEIGKSRHFLDYSPEQLEETNKKEKILNKSGHGDDIFHYISGNVALTLISHVQQAIHMQEGNSPFDIDLIRDDDPDALSVAASGKMNWILELWGHDNLESKNLMYCLEQIEPHCFEEIAATLVVANSHEDKLVNFFIEQKQTGTSVQYPVPSISEYLNESYGTIIYQEQILQIICKVTGYTMDQANRLRKIFGRKAVDDLTHEEPLFVGAAGGKGMDNSTARQLFNWLNDATSFGRIKSHAIAETMIVYRCAYLKAHFAKQYAEILKEISEKHLLKYSI